MLLLQARSKFEMHNCILYSTSVALVQAINTRRYPEPWIDKALQEMVPTGDGSYLSVSGCSP